MMNTRRRKRANELTRSPRLPQELVDLTLDHLHDDKRTLAICSLVHRSWVPRSHTYLLRSVTVKNVGNFIAFMKLLKRSPDMEQYIFKLSLVKTHSRETEMDRELLRILQSLPRLDSLLIEKWTATSISDNMRAGLGTCNLSNIKHLTLQYFTMHDVDFMRLLRACPSLSVLCVSGLDLLPQMVTSDTRGMMDLIEMGTFVAGLQWTSVIKCLLTLPLGVHITTLDIEALQIDTPSLMMNLIDACGTHLEHLTISFMAFSRVVLHQDDLVHFSLTQNPRLVSVHFRFGQWVAFANPELLRYCLSRIQPLHTSLQQICITAPLIETRNHHIPFDQIEHALFEIAPDHQQLEFIFQVYNSFGREGTPEWFTETWFIEAMDLVSTGLPQLLASPIRSGIRCGRPEIGDFRRLVLSDVRERWYVS